MTKEHDYQLGDKVYHPADAAPFIVVGIRQDTIEIEGDWSGGTNPPFGHAADWVSIDDVNPYDESKVKHYDKLGNTCKTN